MFCPKCKNPADKSYDVCPKCGFGCILTEQRAEDVTTSADQPSVSAEEKSQKEDQDLGQKDVTGEQANATQNKGQPPSDDQEPESDGTTSQDRLVKTPSLATEDKGAKSSTDNLTVGFKESFTSVTDTCKEEERLSYKAPESNTQPCREAVPVLGLAVCTTPTSGKHASDDKEIQPDLRTNDRSNARQKLADKPSDILSTSVSSLTFAKEGGTILSQPSDQTTQECDSVTKNATSNDEKEGVQNVFAGVDSEDIWVDCFQEQTTSDEQNSAQDGAIPQDTAGSTAGPATQEKRDFPSSSSETVSESKENPEKVQIPAGMPSDFNSGPMLNSASLQRLTKETSLTLERAEQTSQKSDSVAKLSNSEQNKETSLHEAQVLSEMQDDNADNTKRQTFAAQADENEDQAANEFTDSHLPTKKTAKKNQTVASKIKEKTIEDMTKEQEEMTGNASLQLSYPPSGVDEELNSAEAANILEASSQLVAPQNLQRNESILVHFHAVSSQEWYRKDRVFLISDLCSGEWRYLTEMSSRELEDKRYLFEGQALIPKSLIKKSIPYRYVIWESGQQNYKKVDEILYYKAGNQPVNRCLTIREDYLTYEGEWHQYDDVIHSELKRHHFSFTKAVVMERDLAGRMMLNLIFDQLKTWSKSNIDKFFQLLQQFYYTYSSLVLHDGSEIVWGLPYGFKEAKNLLRWAVERYLNPQKEKKCLLPTLHAGVVRLLICTYYLGEDFKDQTSTLCDLLNLPKSPPQHFGPVWEKFESGLSDKNRLADAVEMLCHTALKCNNEKWLLLIPLIHLLRGESKPFEPVPPALNPQLDSWTRLWRDRGTQHKDHKSLIRIMKDNTYLANIDRLLVRSWMSLLHLDDLKSFTERMQVEVLDLLQHLQFSVQPEITHSNYMTLKELASRLINKLSHDTQSSDDKYRECCLKTAGRLLGVICCHIRDPLRYDVPLDFLDLFCQIAQSTESIQDDLLWGTVETIREWCGGTFRNKLLNAWNAGKFNSPYEIKVWERLLSVSFRHEGHTEFWRMTIMGDIEEKVKREKPVDQIGVYTNMMKELCKTSPLLCAVMEKCAREAIAVICQDQSCRDLSDLFEKHDIPKFGKLLSVVVLKTWPKDANGHDIDGEDLIFEYLLNWPVAKYVFGMSGREEQQNDGLSDEALTKMTLASSAFTSVTKNFYSGAIRMKTLNHIFQKAQEFVDLLKIDGLCDDHCCKDDRNIKSFLKLRKDEAEAIESEKKLVKTLLHICRKLPKHVKVDFEGLDKKLHQNIEMMNLNELVNTGSLGGQTSSSIKVTYFNLCESTRQMASEMDVIQGSTIFKICWTNRVEDLSREQSDTEDTEHRNEDEIYTLDQVYSKIFKSCYSQYKGLYGGLKSGELSLEDLDSIMEDYEGNYKDLKKEFDIMCRTDSSDDRKWIDTRVDQIRQYRDLNLEMESAKIIMDIRDAVCPEGDFELLKKFLQLNQENFKKKNLNCIDENFINAKKMLNDITNNRKECLQKLIESLDFVLWVKKDIKDLNELKVFVDLASIYAGENDMEIDRVAHFHDAVLGYSAIVYGLKQDSDFVAFKESLSKLWKALENDKDIPMKLCATACQLQWLKTVRESHGSVEFSSLSLATSINERGVYIIKAQHEKLTLQNCLMLHIQDGHERSKTYTYEELKELQNKLMLMSGRGERSQSEVESFAEVFDNVQRLAKAFVDLYTAGNPLFKFWEAKIYCKTQTSPCITMEIHFGKTLHHIQVCGNLFKQLALLSHKMELFLDDWQHFMEKQRTDFYYLNLFTADQIFYLCSVLTQNNVDVVMEDKALMMLSFVKPNCTTSDVWRTWKTFLDRFVPIKRMNDDIPFKSHFRYPEESHMSSGNMGSSTADDPADDAVQTVGLKELEKLWNDYMDNEGMFFHDLLDIRSLGGLLKKMTATEDQNEMEWEQPVLSEKKYSSFRRSLPGGLSSNQPNLIICPRDDVLTSTISLYMASEYDPLPSYDEVLLCTPETSREQVELFLRRCLTPGDIGQKIYTMLWADQLTYDVSCAMEKCFQKLHSLFKRDSMLVIFCSSDREHTYIPTAFSQFKRDVVPQEPLESIQKYLSRHYTMSSDHRNFFKGDHSVGIVASQRAGVGKSLYVQRLYEKLQESVEGTTLRRCIRVTEPQVNEHKILQSLYDTPKQKDLTVFHFDITSSVQKGLDEFLFKLLFLRYLMDSDGRMWHCSHKHLCIIELLEPINNQSTNASKSGRKENSVFSDIFPKVMCHSPKEVIALEMKREENVDQMCEDPLMDDEYFRSEVYQRPYQYLTRFHNKSNLDKFTYSGIEGTHTECLQILLIYCGIIDPSWAELRNFVWFLNRQLQDCENSVFCKSEFVGDTLQGFKNFVVEFMILMSKDFATPSLCITDQSQGRQQIDNSGLNEQDLAPFLIRKRWESEPHPYIFFNDDHMSMTFIGFHLERNNQGGVDAKNPLTGAVIKRNIMSRVLYTGLIRQKVPFNTDFDQLPRAERIELLCGVLGIKNPKDPDETYELTMDNILKMMAIHMRFRCGIPVIIMGETGCGKTRLMKFMCELKRGEAQAENLKLVKVHGGTTSEVIHEKVREAETLARSNKENHELYSVLFFDEANTTDAISCIKEILCDNTVQGEQLCPHTGLQIVAACNPYRRHTDEMIERLEASGLGYRVKAEDTEDRLGSIPLRQLVYRVHALPPSMIPLVWDFGQLNDPTEQMYIEQIVQRQTRINSIKESYISTITQVLSTSQKFMRERKDECSFVSLRDVERCMQVFVWFHKHHSVLEKELKAFLENQNQRERNKIKFSPACDRVIWSLLMATGVCYQACLEDKGPYLETISPLLPEYSKERVLQEIQLMQDLLLSGVPMGETIARNEALKENFFMMVICVELRIPLFIVGKPGSSKSLSKTLVAHAMQGPASHSELYKRLKQIHLVSFQCSPHSTPEGIINTFKQCARFQENKKLDEYISVVVLDEIGLAEDSPKMPLKTLHPLLEEGCVDDEPQPHQRVGFIGISNWALDPAKMNRGIFVSRGDPNLEELIKSAEGICTSDKKSMAKIEHLFEPFAKAYETICQEGKGFFGLRDFYSLIKMVFTITKHSNERPTADEITGAVLRNFSGKDGVNVMGIFSNELTDDFADACIPTNDMVTRIIFPSCQGEDSRYLLILTKNYAALQILEQIFSTRQIHPEIIFGSSFPKDQEYTQICRNINRVKVCMETGQTVVLLNLQNLYESLYDALNQYYVTLGGQKYVDLGLGTHRVKCRVHKNFRLIVIEEKEVVYEQFPIPLINRLEKHYLDINTVLRNEQKDIVKQLQKWVDDFVASSNQPYMKKPYVASDVFIGYHSDTCSSVVLQVTENHIDETDAQTILDEAKAVLLNCSTPDSVIRLDKSRLPVEEREHLVKEYFKGQMHSSLGDYIIYHRRQLEQSHIFFTEVTTFSRLLTAADTQEVQSQIKLDNIHLLSLQQFDTEFSFLKKIRECLGSTPADQVLIIQTDYEEDSHKRNVFSSAKYACVNEINKLTAADNKKPLVYFVTKLPRIKGGTSYVGFQGGAWRSVHIDDLRRPKEIVMNVDSLKKLSMSEIFEDSLGAVDTEDQAGFPQNNETIALDGLFDIPHLLRSCVQSAVSMLRDAADNAELSTRRVENLLTLLDESQTQGVFANIVRKRIHSLLKDYEANTDNPKSWVLRVASDVSALQEGGTFLHTLWRKLQAVVTPLLANLVSVIDRDCNLDLLLNGSDDVKNLWLEIFSSKDMLHEPSVMMRNNVIMVLSHVTGSSTMSCCMPFSWWIKDFLDGLMMQTSRHESHALDHVLQFFVNTPLGKYMNKNVNEKTKKEFFNRYLQDFASMTFKVGSVEELQLMCQALASCVDEIRRQKRDEDELCLPLIHIAYCFYQSRLQNLSRMLALQPDVVTPLRRNAHIQHCPEMVLDVYAAQACIEYLESPKLDTDALCLDWMKQVKRLQPSFEMICFSNQPKLYGQRCNERLHDVGKGWKRIQTLSLFAEHMLLGFSDDENQLRSLVQKHIQTLSKVLDRDSDVKLKTAFEAVIQVLKSCKQGASDQIFRFGLHCGVCKREPQDAVGLPCHHIYCSTCIRASLDSGQAACPMCRQELPNDFRLHVSDEIRVSIMRHAEFKRRCNSFFINLLSTVCFKDNTPPARAVINHLLSYLMVETENREIHTKDLSPFDESPDKNPVVRSVILKLLLKFSFDDVEEYLQKHLSSVEDSRIVNEEDKAELYALYINCLEDSMWEKMPQEGNKTEELVSFTNYETQFLRSFLASAPSVPETVSVQYLRYIARLRICLTLAAQLISDNLSENDVPVVAEDFLNVVSEFCKKSGNDWFRVYLIRKLSEQRGVQFVQTLVKQTNFRWLFPEEILQQDEHESQLDQFLMYGEEYKAVRDAVAKAVKDGDVDQIEEVCERCTVPTKKRAMFLLLALFREVTTLYRSANTGLHPTPEKCEKFEELIQGSRYLPQRQFRDFASAMVHNKLGALSMNREHSITDNTVIELTVHLAAVLLTGTQTLLMPLKQLGLSPEKMQGAFIPTMPDDMLAIARTVLQQEKGFAFFGELRWYVCPNNHPCVVDRCGKPMEKGICPECRQEVGGESHVALPNFRPVQLQQDQTRPGHILGDPERRNNPDALDTKNMSLAPFTLVRLVTHLTMLLGASEKSKFIQKIIHPPVENACQFLTLHLLKDREKLSQTLGKGADDTVTTIHLVIQSLQELVPAHPSEIDPYLTTKASRNSWETTVADDIMTPRLRDLDRLLQQAKQSIRTDSRVSSNFIMRTALSDDCSFLTSLAQGSRVHSSAVWSCRERLSLLSLTHIVEQHDQKEELPLLWRFLQKEGEFCQIMHLPGILILQKYLVRKFQNASDQIVGSIRDFISKQTGKRAWFEKHIDTFLKTWNLLRVSVTSNGPKIPEEFCSEDLSLDSDLQYLLPRRQGPGLCATGLVSYLVSLQNELVHAVETQTGEDNSSYRVSLAELTEQHVIRYEVDKDLLPLVLSNCQYSLEQGRETISQYDLPRIQQQILTRFLQGKPLITLTGIPTLVNTQERGFETIFKDIKGKVPQDPLTTLTRNTVSRKLESYSEVCEALKIVELLLGFLSMTGGNPKTSLVSYLQDTLKMADNIDHHLQQALGRCHLTHCVCLWQLLSSLKSESMLRLKREPFSGYPADYQEMLTEENKTDLRGFLHGGNVDQWLLEMHEFLLLKLGQLRATEDYKPTWGIKMTLTAHMEHKEVEVPPYVEDRFPDELLLSQIVETWKFLVTVRQEMMEG